MSKSISVRWGNDQDWSGDADQDYFWLSCLSIGVASAEALRICTRTKGVATIFVGSTPKVRYAWTDGKIQINSL
jgi:hypothetical protein